VPKQNLLHVTVHEGVPDHAQRLIWEVFFRSRGRGLSFGRHFPWVTSVDKIRCITLTDNTNNPGEVLGTLVIRKDYLEGVGHVGLIGLVCVDNRVRGIGYSTALLKQAEICAKEMGVCALLLWTTKPEVYKGKGYLIDYVDMFGKVNPTRQMVDSCGGLSSLGLDLVQNDISCEGVPPFAENLILFQTQTASAKVSRVNSGYSLLEWSGDYDSIVWIMRTKFSDAWTINIPPDSRILPSLIKCGYSLSIEPGAIRMIKYFDDKQNLSVPYIPILNRI
jgi:hypothetical protein